MSKPMLADGVPYEHGMEVWDMFGQRAKDHIRYGKLEYLGPSGWFLGGLELLTFYSSRKAWLKDQINLQQTSAMVARQQLIEAETMLAALEKERDEP